MQFTLGDKREFYLLDESALPVTEKESRQEGKGLYWLIQNRFYNVIVFWVFKVSNFTNILFYSLSFAGFGWLQNLTTR